MTEIKEAHIGQLVKSVFDSSDMSVSELARRLHCERTNVYTIFRRRSIDVEQLAKLSKILNHNFLEDAMEMYGLVTMLRTPLNLTLRMDDLTEENVMRLMEMLRKVRTDS